MDFERLPVLKRTKHSSTVYPRRSRWPPSGRCPPRYPAPARRSLPLLILVTGYLEYMPKAFSVNAFQYLVKPIDEKEFEDVFARAVRECRCLNRKKNTEPGEILVRSGNITRNVPVDDIYYIEISNRKIIVSMRDTSQEKSSTL